MSVVLLVSLVVLAAALASSIVLLVRTGEVRIGLLTGLLASLGIPQGIALWQVGWGAPLELDLPSAAAGGGLLASLLGLLTVLAVGRILRELERAEALHWESMEGVRGLTELASHRRMELDDKIPLLLEMGCERLGLDIGLLSRVRGERLEVLALHAPDDFPVAQGAALDLADTPCGPTLASARPVARERAARDEGARRDALPFEAYLGACVRVEDEPFGTLVFASLEARAERFTATHKDLAALMAEWVGTELERRERDAKRPETPPRSGPSSPPGRGPRRRPAAAAGVGLNELAERLERRMQRAAGPRAEVVLELAPGLERAREVRIPLEAIVLSLVRRAAESAEQGGKVTVATANHEFERSPGVLPAREPDRYVTLAVSETSGRVDADALSRAFEPAAGPQGEDLAAGEARITLSTIYRMLQRVGGDLSVEVEPGKGSTFTLFLPRAADPPARTAGERPALAPPPPPVGH